MNDNIEKQPPVPPFVRFVASAVPMVFDNSLSYYEALSAMWKYLNDTVNVINNNATVTEEYIQLTKDMKVYMDTYFENLDVQEEINNKLDVMAEDGTLSAIISEYLNSIAIFGFDTVADMKSSTNLVSGSYARTLGYYSVNDNGGALYRISDTASAADHQEVLSSGLYATLIIEGCAKAEQYGLKADGTDSSLLTADLFKNKKVVFGEGTFVFDSVSIDHDIEIIGNHTTIKPRRLNVTSNRYYTLFNFSNEISVKVSGVTFEGYTDVVTQSGTLTSPNSLIMADTCKEVRIENCTFKNFDCTYTSGVSTAMVERRAVLFTILDTYNTHFIGNTFNNIKGNEMIYCMDKELDRTDINIELVDNTYTDLYTTALDFIGNIAKLRGNYYDFTYAGSCLNVFALYLFIEDEEVHGSYDNVYDNCEELYFRGIDVNVENVINYATASNTIMHFSAENCIINNLVNENDQVMNCVRNYFGTNSSTIHKDCTTTIAPKTFTKVTNSKLIAKHCVTSYNTSATDYNLVIENCELKSSLSANTWLVATAPFDLTLLNNIIHLCVTAGSGAPAVLYNRSDNILKVIKATNNKMVNSTESQQRFLVGSSPEYMAFIGNTTNRSNSIIAPDLTVVKAYANYNYNES